MRLAALTALHVGVSGGLVWLTAAAAGHLGPGASVLGLAALFALVGLLPMHLELGRSACTFTLVEAVLVLALTRLGPLGGIAVAGPGGAVPFLQSPQHPGQLLHRSLSETT